MDDSRKGARCYVKRPSNLDLQGFNPALLETVLGAKCKSLAFVDELPDRECLSIVICPVVGRLGSSLNKTLEEVRGHKNLVVLTLHHHPPHVPFLVNSEECIDRYDGVRKIIHVVYWQNVGLYECDTNRMAIRHVQSILENLPEDSQHIKRQDKAEMESIWYCICFGNLLEHRNRRIVFGIIFVLFVILSVFLVVFLVSQSLKQKL